MGLRTFQLNKDRLKKLLSLGPKKQPLTIDQFNALFPNNLLTPVPNKKNVYQIDAGDNNSLIALLGDTFGVKSFARPSVIGQTMYGKIMELKGLSTKQARERIVETMGPGYTDGQVDATLSRLKEMIAHLDSFKPNQIIADDAWNDANVQTGIRNTFRNKAAKARDCPNVAPKELQKRINGNFSDYVEYAAEDYFAKEFGKLLP